MERQLSVKTLKLLPDRALTVIGLEKYDCTRMRAQPHMPAWAQGLCEIAPFELPPCADRALCGDPHLFDTCCEARALHARALAGW